MKRFALVESWTVPGIVWWNSANQMLAEVTCDSITKAIEFFQRSWPSLNHDGYYKDERGHTFSVAEIYESH